MIRKRPKQLNLDLSSGRRFFFVIGIKVMLSVRLLLLPLGVQQLFTALSSPVYSLYLPITSLWLTLFTHTLPQRPVKESLCHCCMWILPYCFTPNLCTPVMIRLPWLRGLKSIISIRAAAEKAVGYWILFLLTVVRRCALLCLSLQQCGDSLCLCSQGAQGIILPGRLF